jgi:hypothetical protein
MALEPPPRYVAFVATHLESLRQDAAAALGDPIEGDHLYPDVLTDVAARWRWLELTRAWLRRPDAAEGYLHRSLGRRSQRWQATWIPVEGPEVEFVVWRPGSSGHPRPVFSSGATRLAPFLRPGSRVESGAVAEAAVAWWHAYETRRRHRYIALGVVLFLALVLLAQASAP